MERAGGLALMRARVLLTSEEAGRLPETKDIVRRVGAIGPRHVIIKGFPVERPVSIFNPAMIVDERRDTIMLFPRVVLGYYMYVSSIAFVPVSISELGRNMARSYKYQAELVLYPDSKHDVWGTEDPRAHYLDGRLFITYVGRAVNYFDPRRWRNRTRPVTATLSESGKWVKRAVFIPSVEFFGDVVSNKNAFLFKPDDEHLYLFHRIHTKEDDGFYLLLSTVPAGVVKEGEKLREVYVDNGLVVLKPAEWELRLGWGTPPVEVEKSKFVVILHALDHEGVVYRVFAMLLRLRGSILELESITPTYIMEPRESFEVYGDRPLVVFPCGAARLDDAILISYGAADISIGIGSVEVSELMDMLESNRLEMPLRLELVEK
uniref:Glycosidase n=1 Tax=Fervidicoccus fontis TaxID=683846 RepID=A0A7J3ZK35_9CREN